MTTDLAQLARESHQEGRWEKFGKALLEDRASARNMAAPIEEGAGRWVTREGTRWYQQRAYISQETVDFYDTIVTRQAIIDAWPGYMGNVRLMHGAAVVGRVFKEDATIDDIGVRTWFSVPEWKNDVIQDMTAGLYRGVSIGFWPTAIEWEKDEDGKDDYTKPPRITGLKLAEISIVDAGATPGTNFDRLRSRARGLWPPAERSSNMPNEEGRSIVGDTAESEIGNEIENENERGNRIRRLAAEVLSFFGGKGEETPTSESTATTEGEMTKAEIERIVRDTLDGMQRQTEAETTGDVVSAEQIEAIKGLFETMTTRLAELEAKIEQIGEAPRSTSQLPPTVDDQLRAIVEMATEQVEEVSPERARLRSLAMVGIKPGKSDEGEVSFGQLFGGMV